MAEKIVLLVRKLLYLVSLYRRSRARLLLSPRGHTVWNTLEFNY